MNDSILNSIKKMLGITEEYEHFDQDIIAHINSAFMILTQLGVGPSSGFFITDKSATWSNFITNGETTSKSRSRLRELAITQAANSTTNVGMIQSYIYMKVKLLFDPPQNSFLVDSLNKSISEYEWRLNAMFDKPIY